MRKNTEEKKDWTREHKMKAIWLYPEDYNVIKAKAKGRKMSKTKYIQHLLNLYRAEL